MTSDEHANDRLSPGGRRIEPRWSTKPSGQPSASTTGTPHGAREHARAQAGRSADAIVHLPANSFPRVPEGVAPEALIWAETVSGGGYAAKVIARGASVRLTDLDGDACAHMVCFNADATWERLNVADTIKVLWQAYVGASHLLLSDQGRVLASLQSDTSGRHDALCGTSVRSVNEHRYGDGSAHGATPAGRELLCLAAAKHGLGPRDLPPSVSFFKGVTVNDDGSLRFDGSPRPGAAVTLRAELPLVLLIANVPHPLDPREEYRCSRLEVLAWRGAPSSATDAVWTASPEAQRAFLATTSYVEARQS